jgi:HD-GYP domain-containing protein (c-di-GMP phosphodiesterase class II)
MEATMNGASIALTATRRPLSFRSNNGFSPYLRSPIRDGMARSARDQEANRSEHSRALDFRTHLIPDTDPPARTAFALFEASSAVRVIYVSPALARLTGYGNERVFHRHLASLLANCRTAGMPWYRGVIPTISGQSLRVGITLHPESENADVPAYGLLHATLPSNFREPVSPRRRLSHSRLTLRPPFAANVPRFPRVGEAFRVPARLPGQDSWASAAARMIRHRLGDYGEHLVTLDELVTAVGTRNGGTRAHTDEVMIYSLLIAEDMGLSPGLCRAVAIAGLLHDVGKIAIPSHILRLPRALTPSEYIIVQRHATIGGLLTEMLTQSRSLQVGIMHHHEAWDGRGYPHGLSGPYIPIEARIVAVADAFSAMTEDRPYRRGMSRQNARIELEKGRGRQWDPNCVDSMRRVLQETLGTTNTLEAMLERWSALFPARKTAGRIA